MQHQEFWWGLILKTEFTIWTYSNSNDALDYHLITKHLLKMKISLYREFLLLLHQTQQNRQHHHRALRNNDVIHSLAHSPAIRVNLCRIPIPIYWLTLHLLNPEKKKNLSLLHTHTHTHPHTTLHYTTLKILQRAIICLWANAVSTAFHLCFMSV